MLRTSNRRVAASLIELLVVIAILMLLIGLVVCGVQAARGAAARVECQSRMRQLALAAHGYHAAHQHFPAGVAYPFSKTEYQEGSQHTGLSWQTALLPYLEQDALWQRAWAAHAADPTGESLEHDAVAAHPLPTFRCPTDGRTVGRYSYEPMASEHSSWGLTNFLGVAGTGLSANNGVFHPDLSVNTGGMTDGTSNTVMIGERPTSSHGYGNSWYSGWGTLRYSEGQLMPVHERWANAPARDTACPTRRTVFQTGRYDDPCHQKHFWSQHPGGGNFAFADGSVRFLPYSAAGILPALATHAGGESVSVE